MKSSKQKQCACYHVEKIQQLMDKRISGLVMLQIKSNPLSNGLINLIVLDA